MPKKKCYRCGTKTLVKVCKYCDNSFCEDHSLPENHACPDYKDFLKNEKRMNSQEIEKLYDRWDAKAREQRSWKNYRESQKKWKTDYEGYTYEEPAGTRFWKPKGHYPSAIAVAIGIMMIVIPYLCFYVLPASTFIGKNPSGSDLGLTFSGLSRVCDMAGNSIFGFLMSQGCDQVKTIQYAVWILMGIGGLIIIKYLFFH